jgi:hypothetical protein
MFHTEVVAASGTVIDFDRALPQMDKDLFQDAIDAIDAMILEQGAPVGWDADWRAQLIWDDYCDRHHKKFGEEFGPNVIPRWGLPPEPPTEPLDPADYDVKDIVVLTRERMPHVLAQFSAKYGDSNPWPEFEELLNWPRHGVGRGALWMWDDH